MSHFTTVNVDVDDLSLAAEALQSLGLRVESRRAVSSFYGQSITPDLTVFIEGRPLIGLVRESNGRCRLVADWWLVERVAGVSQENFANAFRQRYSHLKVKREAQRLGFRIISETVDDQGSIRMEVVRWR